MQMPNQLGCRRMHVPGEQLQDAQARQQDESALGRFEDGDGAHSIGMNPFEHQAVSWRVPSETMSGMKSNATVLWRPWGGAKSLQEMTVTVLAVPSTMPCL